MEDSKNSKQPLLLKEEEEEEEDQVPALLSTISRTSFQRLSNLSSFFTSFVADDEDIAPIDGFNGFVSAFRDESSKLWFLAGPAIFTSLCQYSLGAFTQTFAGHVGTLELAAFSIENSVIAGLSLGVMLGMGSAVETLCGQAFGAGQLDMLGVYLQRSWLILLVTGVLLMFLYIFAYPFLLLIGQTRSISLVAGKLAMWMIPQLFAYALNFPTAKFLQSQSKIMAMAWISAGALALHVAFSWLVMLKLGWGMAGGAAVLDVSWWLIVILQIGYVFSGTCGKAWDGFSLKAFSNLWGFVKLSLASAVMMCLEAWYFMALILFAGYLKDAEVSVAALSVCTNILGWTNTISLGFNAAISVRVSNELGASRPRTAKFSVVVMVISSFLIGTLVAILLLLFQNQYPSLFTDSDEVKSVVYDLTPLLAFCIVVNSIQPGLSGVAIGAGWQGLIAYVNIVCYYVFGVPLGLLLGYPLKMGVRGIWYGMVAGTVVQTLILFWIVYKTDWNKEMGSEGPKPAVTIHVTGFKKFHGVSENPTEAIINNLQEYMNKRGLPKGMIIGSCTILETAGQGATGPLYQTLQSAVSMDETTASNENTVIWVHFGVNSGATRFAIEQQAVNEATFRCPDEMGWKPQKVPIVPADGVISRVRETSLPVEGITKSLAKMGYEVMTSDDAGRFVCNYVYYHSLRFAEQNGMKSLFVHVPLFLTIDEETQMQFAVSLLEVLASL